MKKNPKDTDKFNFADSNFSAKREVARHLGKLYDVQNSLQRSAFRMYGGDLNRTDFGLAIQNATLEGVKILSIENYHPNWDNQDED